MLVTKTSRFATKGRQTNVPQTSKLVVHELMFGDQTSMTSANTSGSVSLDTSTMFENNSNSDYVQNSIGDVTQGTTVSQIRTQYPELDDLIKSMLKIDREPVTTPQAVEYGVTWGFNDVDVEVPTYTHTPSIIIDRGKFSPEASSPIPNPTPLGTIQTATLTDPNGTTHNLTVPAASSQGVTRTFTLTAPSVTFNSGLGEVVYNANVARATFNEGDPALNNYGTNFGSLGLANIGAVHYVTGTRTIRFHAPVIRGSFLNNTSTGASGYAGTDKMFSTTTYAYIISHAVTETIDVPKEPTALHQYTQLLDPWSPCSLNTEWTKTQISTDFGSGVFISYWRVTWIGIARGLADIRLSF